MKGDHFGLHTTILLNIVSSMTLLFVLVKSTPHLRGLMMEQKDRVIYFWISLINHRILSVKDQLERTRQRSQKVEKLRGVPHATVSQNPLQFR